MDPFGGRPVPTRAAAALGAGLAAAALVLWGCGGGQSARADHSASRATPVRSDPTPSLPGVNVSKRRDRGGQLRRVRYRSPALGRADSYLIYLPPGYSALAKSGRRLPVLYLLHGDGRHDRHTAGHLFQRGRIGTAATALMRQGRMQPMLIVMPESTDKSVVGDTEWANTSRGRFAGSVLDVVRAVDRRWPTIDSRSARAIAGLSMGGYGAMNIALRHPTLFSVAESWSGYFKQTPTGPFRGASRSTLERNSPAHDAKQLRRGRRAEPLHVLLYTSRTDPLHVQQAPFASKLRRLGVSVEAHLFSGPHNFALWANHMRLALGFAARWLSSGGTG